MCRTKHRASAIVFCDSTSVRSTLLILSFCLWHLAQYTNSKYQTNLELAKHLRKWHFTTKCVATRQIKRIRFRFCFGDRSGSGTCSTALRAVLSNLRCRVKKQRVCHCLPINTLPNTLRNLFERQRNQLIFNKTASTRELIGFLLPNQRQRLHT